MGKRAGRKCLLVVSALLVFMMSLSITANAAAKPKLSAAKKTLTVGKSNNLTLKNYSKKVSFSSSNKAVVTGKRVNNNTVKLTAKKAGTAKITVKAGSKKYICKITVKDSPKLNKTSLTLTAGETYDLKVTGTAKTAKWSTTKKSVAAISKKSKYVYRVSAKKEGTAYIKVKINNKTYKCKVKVKAKKVSNANLDKAMITGYVGQVEPVNVSLTGTTSNAKWKIADNGIAEISAPPYSIYGSEATGKSITVRMKNAGTTVITAEVDGKTLKTTLVVKKFTNPPKGTACLWGQTYADGKMVNAGAIYVSNGDNTFWKLLLNSERNYLDFMNGEAALVSDGDNPDHGLDIYRKSNASEVLYTVKLPGLANEIALPFYNAFVVDDYRG